MWTSGHGKGKASVFVYSISNIGAIQSALHNALHTEFALMEQIPASTQ